MTQMRAREVRLNLILSIVFSVLGLFIRVLGETALKKGFFLPEYAKAARGFGGVIFLIGVLWIALTLVKRMLLPAERSEK